jgi:hypothetical protein
MRYTLSFIERTFRALLRLYPADFQTEFRDEMLEVAMACWKEKRMSGFVDKCRAFLKEAASLLVLAPREWMRSFLKRPLSPVRAGLRCALAFATGVLTIKLIESTMAPLGDTSILLHQVTVLVMRIAFHALIGLVTGLLLKASRTGPLVVARVLGSIASCGVRLATTRYSATRSAFSRYRASSSSTCPRMQTSGSSLGSDSGRSVSMAESLSSLFSSQCSRSSP